MDLQKQPRIIDKKVDEHQIATADLLGKPKINGHGERDFPDDMVFGCPSVTFHQDGVDKLIQGQYSSEEQQPDADLGKSLREGWRNIAKSEQVDQVRISPLIFFCTADRCSRLSTTCCFCSGLWYRTIKFGSKGSMSPWTICYDLTNGHHAP